MLARMISAVFVSLQIDFTEGRLSLKLDPSGGVLSSFIDLNNMVLARFSADEQQRIGVHTCPGADKDSTHSADVDYAELLPSLFELKAGNFYIAMACERDPERSPKIVARYLKPDQRAFIGVIDVIDPRVETPEEVCARVLEAARYIPRAQLGTTDDCGFSPFCDDDSTDRATAFAKIRARVAGTALASLQLGLA
jgi:5-methyltetrahydropteroyltriglutamate--homocysteine methyltransferase